MKHLLTILKYALLLSVSGLLMWYAVQGQDLSRIGQSVREANYSWLVVTMILSALGYFSRAYRWKMQIDPTGHKPSYWDVYHAMMVGYLANLVLPRMGEVIRCSVLQRTSKVPVQVSLGTVVTERVIDVMVLLGLLGATLLLDFQTFWAFVTDKILGGRYDELARNPTPLVVAGLIAIVLLVGLIYTLFRNLERLRQNALFNKVVVFVKGLLAGVFSILKLENKGLFLLHTAFTWLVYYLMDYLAFFCFPATYDLGMRAGLAVLTFGAFGMAAPVAGGIGPFHVMVQGILLAYGISKDAGIAYALVVHGSQTLLVVLMGGISFAVSMLKSGRTVSAVTTAPLTVASSIDVE
ncbi:lysylphosphatidylglycerol synthase transmembrane domain-containing protein [Hymenobacter sp. GOD-10R]|uniref:lysylphosphatidylglycerol synthase transmembrane domain-containing protein n=1 Tax=Hymenobacter sp. GOD-10R TaxID=3093922 RepID=UPI002D79CB79|nr:lysylphosphatidylglycerol synthase transmembrane domain-containing protein [Hymenobacter sp. GOD-10R]WRQ28491.1 lysylphosphatidylglycerol synthase transmembrane domain-containing protein [Hymenobacter sp. GOD-10R]